MKSIIAILFALALNSTSFPLKADNTIEATVLHIESEWAHIYYRVAKQQQAAAFDKLLVKVQDLRAQHPKQAELIIQQAIIVATNAANISPFNALTAIHKARELLLLAIRLNPNALDGAAFVTLGTLYHKVPGWPIAYGDDEKAQAMLEKALLINPNTIDANYFYADFLATQSQQHKALTYFQRALAIPARTTQLFADEQLHIQAKQAISDYNQGLENHHQPAILAANQ